MSLEKLYQLTIMEYNRRDDLRGEIENATDIERGHNPSCGDDLSIILKVEEDKIVDASFLGSGCAISTASSAMLVELVKGIKIDEAKDIVNIFFKVIKDEYVSDNEKEMLGEAKLLEITKDMPARIKCSTLAWHSLKVILEKY
ncbi:Fe-S cluster assembly sulfur transfer protein SufU [Streptobacillus moniliformis]|uniref:SUF system FeS assembly protein, NifU family n=1 Tax=Streptobacillus moniliformis (strain ATCC 14647 / DSM 12112 / NCTC 10651 / 9901) TaxID=519441 RepID=D1AUX2_STRM9|nr:SUF system NifU family Fe-S cluster assembly protein [Streptobacillus moniliformis]ACZ01532.1 SUF system FeS assembly protein, NifU family [Streptobacillus moniliformis DSM 12112]AVL43469.1 SUF system NifU family Fe-S cluster assembly protein [Streptobacillus moniliformis]QXW66209.1 SUF system NifU family Fe-S cluster assembly protein [Streptobacillus moniliformis]SQA13301.1 NifU-like protein [Streptobacillus moniliformis]